MRMASFTLLVGLLVGCGGNAPAPAQKATDEEAVKKELKSLQEHRNKEWAPPSK